MKFKEYLLKDIATITMGQSPKSQFYNEDGKGIEFLQGVRTFGEDFPYFDTYTTKYNRLAYKNSILFSVRAPVGRVNWATKNIAIGRGVASISVKNMVYDRYVYYYFKKMGSFYDKKATGTVFTSINKKELESLKIKVPASYDDQKRIADRLATLDRKIHLNQQLNANLTNQLNSMFDKMYYESSSRIELMNFISEMKSGDWGKAKLTDNFIKPAVIIRGTDFCNVANGQKSDAPIRYLKTATIQKKHLIANDVLIEISGGSPTQSTGRSLLITDKLLNRYNTPVLGTNFTRLFRCETEENAVLFHSYINFLYNKNVFFNYENGTTGIKNLDYKSILKINVNDVQKHSLFPKYFSMYHFYESMKQHLGDESTVLTCLKEQLLRKFF